MASAAGLPRSTFAKLLPHSYLLANLSPSSDTSRPPIRSNGRAPDTAREPSINLSSLSHAHGSALVRIGDTTVICGVRGETLLTSNLPGYRPANHDRELLDYDLLVPNIELATGSAPQFLPGVPPTTLAQTLSTRVFSLLHSASIVRPDDLRIWYTPESLDEGADADTDMKDEEVEDNSDTEASGAVIMAYWVLYIDVFFVSFDGNAFDAAWAATMAALHDTKLPKASWDPDREMIFCSRDESSPLYITSFPIACTAAVLTEKDLERPSEGRFWLLLDPNRAEENLCDESVTVVVDKSREGAKTRILSLSKSGGTVLSPELLRGFVGIAEERWEQFRRAMP